MDFQSPPAGEPIQIISESKGSNAIQFTLPFPLLLPLEMLIGVLMGPIDTQLAAEDCLAVLYFSFSFSHSIYSAFGLKEPLFETLSVTKSIARA